MPFRQVERRIAHDGAYHAQPDRLDDIARQPPVPLAAEAVEHDAGHTDVRIVSGKTLGDGGGRGGLSRNVEHQKHRQSVEPGEIGGRARSAFRSGDTVEQTHRAFEDDVFGVIRCLRGQSVEQGRGHRPAVEIDARQASSGGVEAGIDIVRSGLRAAYLQSAASERAQQADGDAGLARAGARRADDDRARRHVLPASSARMATMPPTTISAGEASPAAAACSAMVARVATTMRSWGVVAATITAAGVDATRPPRSKAAAIAGRLAMPI